MAVDSHAVLELLHRGRGRVARAWTGDAVEIQVSMQMVGRGGPCKVCVVMALWLEPDTGETTYDPAWDAERPNVKSEVERRLCAVIDPARSASTVMLFDWNDQQDTVEPVLAVYDQAIQQLVGELAG
jgi:hypothetical protein